MTRILTFGEARNDIDLDVIVLIAAAFGVGAAIETTSLAGQAADGLVGALDGLGDVGIPANMLAVIAVTAMTVIQLTRLLSRSAARSDPDWRRGRSDVQGRTPP